MILQALECTIMLYIYIWSLYISTNWIQWYQSSFHTLVLSVIPLSIFYFFLALNPPIENKWYIEFTLVKVSISF